jgi:hypothetical protein
MVHPLAIDGSYQYIQFTTEYSNTGLDWIVVFVCLDDSVAAPDTALPQQYQTRPTVIALEVETLSEDGRHPSVLGMARWIVYAPSRLD